MANLKISQLDPFSGNVQNDDLFEVVDVSDSSMSPTGTNKKVTWQDMKSDLNDTYLRLNGANGPLTGDIDTQNLLPDSATAQIGTEQAPYLEVNAQRFKMSSDPGGFWAIAKSPDPANKLQFIRDAGSGQTIPYTLATTGVPTDGTDLATKAYVDAIGVTGTPTEVPFFDSSGDLTSNSSFNFDLFNRTLNVENRINANYAASVLIGTNAGRDIVVGSPRNGVAVGFNAGREITTSAGYVAIGASAMESAGAGNFNVAVGLLALRQTTGQRNVGIGASVFNEKTSGDFNVGIGSNALVNMATGSFNIAIGYNCAALQNDGTTKVLNVSNSIYIGAQVKATQAASNEITIGYQSEGRGTNTAVFGNDAITDSYLHGNLRADQFTLYQLNTPPATSSDPGDEGQILIDANSIYICTAANTWKKVDLTTF